MKIIELGLTDNGSIQMKPERISYLLKVTEEIQDLRGGSKSSEDNIEIEAEGAPKMMTMMLQTTKMMKVWREKLPGFEEK